jgi:hypothetical protein
VSWQTVKTHYESFLESYFGGADSSQVAPIDELRRRGLRLITLANPERTVQGELVHYLLDKKANAVSECGIADDSARYSADVVVFNADWLPICVIELKHYSANQGKIDALLHNMAADAARHREGPQGLLPLLQIGLYTEIANAFHRRENERAYGLYRFISTYYNGPPRQSVVGQRPKVPGDFGGRLVAPAPTSFALSGTQVAGRVGWILRAVEPELSVIAAQDTEVTGPP